MDLGRGGSKFSGDRQRGLNYPREKADHSRSARVLLRLLAGGAAARRGSRKSPSEGAVAGAPTPLLSSLCRSSSSGSELGPHASRLCSFWLLPTFRHSWNLGGGAFPLFHASPYSPSKSPFGLHPSFLSPPNFKAPPSRNHLFRSSLKFGQFTETHADWHVGKR